MRRLLCRLGLHSTYAKTVGPRVTVLFCRRCDKALDARVG